MTKYSFLVYHAEYQAFLEKLRDLGVVHLIEKQKEATDSLFEQYEQIKKVSGVIKFLSARVDDTPKSTSDNASNGMAIFKEVESLQHESEIKQQQLSLLRKEISYATIWGDFSPQTIDQLRDKRVQLKLYSVSTRKFNEAWLQQYPISVISQQAGISYLAMFLEEGQSHELDLEEMRIPERPVSELRSYENLLVEEIQSINARFDHHAMHSQGAIKHYQLQLTEDFQFKNALYNTGEEANGKVMFLEGWAPAEIKARLVEFLDKGNVLYLEERPKPEDKVPILLKNKRFSKKFEPLVEFYSLPKYGELDLTPFFAPFYMIFFGFCLGDAGYGAMMLLAALLLKKKVDKGLRDMLGLVFYLGLSTIFFGIIGGTLFGIPLYETGLPVYSTLAAQFEARDTDINQLLFYLALVLGGIQILFGMFLKVINEIRQFGWGFALGSIGWLMLLVGGGTLYGVSMLTGIPMEQLSIPLYIILGVSGILILPLNNLGRNPLINTGTGIWNTYNMVTGLLGDLLSYIRLFALSISSAILGFVFNSIAVEMSGNIPVVSMIVMIIILVIGHAINLFMSGLGAFVHPLRLTFVEFYKNAGFTGGGKKYEPFKKLT
ncbi:MAG TPA: V-type ATPase 116kDa subunit family protein [Bacteroidales bacterium]|nr:V-type ATPase 116kDa subunit family protein [Bacteroidales bacterium]